MMPPACFLRSGSLSFSALRTASGKFHELKIEDMEFDAIIAAVSSGKADFGAAGITVKEDRKKNIDFTDTYTKACQVIVVRNK